MVPVGQSTLLKIHWDRASMRRSSSDYFIKRNDETHLESGPSVGLPWKRSILHSFSMRPPLPQQHYLHCLLRVAKLPLKRWEQANFLAAVAVSLGDLTPSQTHQSMQLNTVCPVVLIRPDFSCRTTLPGFRAVQKQFLTQYLARWKCYAVHIWNPCGSSILGN